MDVDKVLTDVEKVRVDTKEVLTDTKEVLNEALVDTKHILQNKWVQLGMLSAIVVGGGVAAGIYIWKKRKKAATIVVPAEDPQLSLDFDRVVHVGPIDPTPRQAPFRLSMQYKDAMEELQKRAENNTDVSEVITTDFPPEENSDEETVTTPHHSIFGENEEDVWEFSDELRSRDPSKPYILHVEEFLENDSGFHQSTVTYYAGDDVLANQEDTPIYDFQNLLGELKFGHGSNDKNVVYIRNEKVKSEWEVLYHPGKFTIEVLGDQYDNQDPTLQHSVQKFRDE